MDMAKETALNLLRQVRDCCLFEDDDGRIGVTEDAVIPTELFDRICTEISQQPKRENK